MKVYQQICGSLIVFIFTTALSKPTDESTETDDEYKGADDQGKKHHGEVFVNYLDKEEQLVDSIEYDDNYLVPVEGSSLAVRRALWYPRQFAKKREFLQCKSEEPIVFLCHKSCHNVFKSICFGHMCPPRLLIQTDKECYENCRKEYKNLRGQKYIPPEKF